MGDVLGLCTEDSIKWNCCCDNAGSQVLYGPVTGDSTVPLGASNTKWVIRQLNRRQHSARECDVISDYCNDLHLMAIFSKEDKADPIND